MALDFSILKEIDFTKTENILFFFIILVIALIIFFIVALVISKTIKAIRRLIVGDNVRRPKFDRKVVDEQFFPSVAEKPEKVVEARRAVTNEEIIGKNLSSAEKNKVQEKDIIEIGKEKAEKKIEEGLASLKHDIPGGGLQAKMPQRVGESPEGVVKKEIEIPRAERSPEMGVENKIESGINIPRASKEASASNKGGSSDSSVLFQGRSDVPRMKLEHEMRTNPKIWKAARETMLNLTPIERAKLVKETFSSAYGRNISKTDLKQTVRKLDRKMRASTTPKEHEKLRKEIKFFKKIGGI